MKRLIIFLLMIGFAFPLFAQNREPSGFGNVGTFKSWIKDGLTNITIYGLTHAGALTVGEDDTGYDVKFFGATSGNYVFWDESEDLLSVVQTNANTSGTERATTVTLTQTGAGAISEAFYAKVIADVQTGSWVNGIVGRVDYSTGSTGDAGGGMAAAICAEINLPAKSPSGGAYYAFDAEIEAPENFSSITNPTSFPMAFMRTGLWGNGTAKANWEDYGYIFHFDDITDASGNVWYDNTLRCLINTTAFYMVFSEAEGEFQTQYLIESTNTTDASSTTVAALQSDGGLGIAKQAHIGTGLTVGYTTADENEPAFKIIGDADSDAAGDTDDTFQIAITANATPTNATWGFTSTQSAGYTFDKKIDLAAGLDVGTDLDVDGTANLDNTDIDGTFAADGTTFDVNSTTSMTFDNSNTTNGIDINTGTSGSPVDIGHSTSETTVGDNLTVNGDADVVGALTGGTIASDATVTAASTMSTGANAGTSGQITFIASDNDQGTVTINTSDNLAFAGFAGGVDVDGDFTAGSVASDAGVSGTSVTIAPSAAGAAIDLQLETEWVSGTLIDADFGSATTLDDDAIGFEMDLNGNVTMTTDKDVTAISLKLPALSQTAANTTAIYGLNLSTAGALVQSSGAGTINWRGVNIQMPNSTQTTGTVSSIGIDIAGGTLTSGTAYGIDVTGSFTRGAHIATSMANANVGDGYGAAIEVDVTTTGTNAGHLAAASAWVNVNSAVAAGGNLVAARNDGIWVNTGDSGNLTNAIAIFGARMHMLSAGNETAACPFSLNVSGTTTDALFYLYNEDGSTSMGYTADGNTGANKIGAVPLYIDGNTSTKYWVYIYDNYN